MIDCSSDPSWQEYAYIPNAQTGQYFIILFTNPLNQPANIIFHQTNIGLPGAGTINNNNVYCNFDTITTTVGACNLLNNQFSVSGEMYFHNTLGQVNTGTLTIADFPSGMTFTHMSPFTSPVAFNFSPILSDGLTHTLTAIFSEAPNCTYTTTYTAPASCSSCTVNAGPDITVCGLTANVVATENFDDVNTHWLPQAGITFSDINSPTTTIFSSSIGAYNLTWQITNSLGVTCTDNITVAFQPIPNSTFNVQTPTCINTPTSVVYTGSIISPNTYSWNFNGANIQTGALPGPYTLTWNTAGTYNISLTVTSVYGCVSNTTTQAVVVLPNGPPCCIVPTPNAGADTIVCGYLYEFENSAPAPGNVITWTQLSGPGLSNFIPGPNYTVTVSAPGIYQFQLTEVNGACDSSDVVVVNFGMPPTPDAGPDQSVCGIWANLCATPTTTGGQWSCPQGCVAYYDPNGNYNASYRDSACALIRCVTTNYFVTMYWTENNGYCAGSDSVWLYFGSIQPAITLVDPADSVNCGPVCNLLNAQQPAFGNGYWMDTVMNTMYTPSQININPTATINAFSYGLHDFYWITVNGNCRDTSDVVTINFKANKILGTVQSSLVSDFSGFYAGLYNEAGSLYISNNISDISTSGNFSIWGELNQNYYLKITKTDPLLYPSIVNTYYSSSYNWQNATLITNTGTCDTLIVNVPLVEINLVNNGLCKISGKVRYDGSLLPVTQAEVYLISEPSDEPVGVNITNFFGNYQMTNIPVGNYSVYVDIPGIPQITTHSITIAAGDTLYDNINFIVDTTSISKQYGFGIYADTSSFIGVNQLFINDLDLSVFPNPASDYIKIISNNLNDKAIVTIYNIEGKKMIEETISQSHNIIYINRLSAGLYTIEIKNDKFVKREKIVKK